MKGFMKKIICMFMVVAMLVPTMTATASAAVSYEKSKVLYYDKNNNYDGIYIYNLSSKDTIKKSSVTTSNKKVVSLSSLHKSTNKGEYMYYESTDSDGSYTNYSYSIGVKIKGSGNATVSFKVGSKTYSTKYTVYKYTNPLSSLTITGINGSKNVASAFKSTGYVSGKKLSKTQSNATINIAAKSGWKIISASYSGDDGSRSVYSSKGISKVTLHSGTLTKGKKQYVYIYLKNTKTGGTISCQYSFS